MCFTSTLIIAKKEFKSNALPTSPVQLNTLPKGTCHINPDDNSCIADALESMKLDISQVRPCLSSTPRPPRASGRTDGGRGTEDASYRSIVYMRRWNGKLTRALWDTPCWPAPDPTGTPGSGCFSAIGTGTAARGCFARQKQISLAPGAFETSQRAMQE
jgi:hypothetical protein